MMMALKTVLSVPKSGVSESVQEVIRKSLKTKKDGRVMAPLGFATSG
jgi:hypothetical protein